MTHLACADADDLTADGTSQTNGQFTVTSIVGASVNVIASAGAGAPAGLTLSAFRRRIDATRR